MKILRFGMLSLVIVSIAVAHPPQEVPSSMTAQEMQGYLSGEGMALVLPALTFGYPDPRRVLEFEMELGLTSEQKGKLQGISKYLSTQARYFGKKFVAEELLLDDFFRTAQTDLPGLSNQLEKIGNLEWNLRLVHLGSYVRTVKILTPEQLEKYRKLASRVSSDPRRN